MPVHGRPAYPGGRPQVLQGNAVEPVHRKQ
jgi:hypothetical protein